MMQDKAGIVTGGASGMGEAVVERLLREGASVVAMDRDGAGLAALSARIGCDRLVTVEGDVSSEALGDTLIEKCAASFGNVRYLVNCAGITSPFTAFGDVTLKDFDAVNSVNLRGTFLTMRAAINHMRDHGGGSIVNISSTAGIRPMLQVIPYTASKWGVVGITLAAALENASAGIRVNVVCPGIVDTPMYRTVAMEYGAGVIDVTPMKRIGTSAEIANAVSWLVSDEASFVTGLVMPVDGGLALT